MGLHERGPVVEVTLTHPPAIAQPIVQAGGILPNPVSGLALIDTGASGTCIDDDAAQQLQNVAAFDVVAKLTGEKRIYQRCTHCGVRFLTTRENTEDLRRFLQDHEDCRNLGGEIVPEYSEV
jgi:hypothetical protein